MVYNENDKSIYQADLIKRNDIMDAIKDGLPIYMHDDVMRIIGRVPSIEIKHKPKEKTITKIIKRIRWFRLGHIPCHKWKKMKYPLRSKQRGRRTD
jgi:hypothetical protein